MNLSHTSLGIDLREDRLIFSHLRRSFGRVRITASNSLPLSPSKPKEERELELIGIIQEYVSSHNFSKDNVVISLPREKGLVKLVEVPSAAKENLRKVLEYELGKYVPFPPEEASFDFQILEEREGSLRVLLVVVKQDEVTQYLELLKRMGIRPAAIEVSSIASANLFFYDQHPVDRRPFVLVDIGKRYFEFHFFENGGLKEAFHFSFVNEQKKATEIEEAYRLALLKGLGSKAEGQSIFIFGEGANQDLIEELKQRLSADITVAQSLKRINSANGFNGVAESYASIGLALKGVSKTKWSIDLLPLNLRKKVSRIGYYFAIFLSIVALVLVGTWAVHPLLREKDDLDRVLLEVKAKKPMVDAVDAIQKKKEGLEKEIREFETLKAEETSKLDILKELSDILPPTVWIWNMKLKSKEVEINGFADSASDLIAIIDKSPLFEKVEFSSPVTTERRLFGDKAEKQRFRISAKIERAK